MPECFIDAPLDDAEPPESANQFWEDLAHFGSKGKIRPEVESAMTKRHTPPPPGLIQHTDRGSQYCSHDYQRLPNMRGIIPSMSGKGNCYDNAMVETVFKTIKTELIWRASFQIRKAAEWALGRYINGFYNPSRRQPALGDKSPVSFEADMPVTD